MQQTLRNRIARDLIVKYGFSADHLNRGRFVSYDADELTPEIERRLGLLTTQELVEIMTEVGSSFGQIVHEFADLGSDGDTSARDHFEAVTTPIILETISEQLRKG